MTEIIRLKNQVQPLIWLEIRKTKCTQFMTYYQNICHTDCILMRIQHLNTWFSAGTENSKMRFRVFELSSFVIEICDKLLSFGLKRSQQQKERRSWNSLYLATDNIRSVTIDTSTIRQNTGNKVSFLSQTSLQYFAFFIFRERAQ